MKFMGDWPLKGQTELDVVCAVLKVPPSLGSRAGPPGGAPGQWGGPCPAAPRPLCADQEVMRDEVYCQIVKQTTDNTSPKMDSCQKGWRLLYILTAYYKCSEVLKPYLLWHLQETCRSPGAQFQGIAKACEQNLRKTFQFGGRREFPSSMELKAMVAGRSAKRQLFLLPGGIERHLKIKTCSVALDVIEEMCYEMGLHRPEVFDEYVIFAVTNGGQNVRPLSRREYILDVATEMEQVDNSYMFWYRRVIWTQPLKFDNELYVTMHYNQVLPDYLKGLFNILPPLQPSEQQCQQVSKLAALQHRAKDSMCLPTVHEVQGYVPPQFCRALKAQSWLNVVLQRMPQVQALSAHQARAQFLGKPSPPCSPYVGAGSLVGRAYEGAARPSPGADGEVLAEGDSVHEDPAAHGRLQLPLRGDHAGRLDVTEDDAAAAGAGTECSEAGHGEVSQCYRLP
uniref:MyTH4 domain-containing protein n=1 Tax=Terrapene triunguis TaxID=2587831 RepID=A0A674JSA4_9SAUR